MATISGLDPRVALPKIVDGLSTFTSFHDFTILSTQIMTNGFQSDIIMEPSTSFLVVSLLPSPLFLLFLVGLSYQLVSSRLREGEGGKVGVERKGERGLEVKLEPMESGKNLISEVKGGNTL